MEPTNPQDQFKQRYNQYVSQKTSPIVPNTFSSPPSHDSSSKKFYILGIIVGFLILTPLAAYMYFTSQKSQTVPPPNKVSSITSTPVKITPPTEAEIDAEMKKIWGQYYEQVKSDPKLRDAAKNMLIRQALIQKGLSANNIKQSASAINSVDQAVTSEELLKEKVVSSRYLDYAFVFVNPNNSEYSTDAKQIVYSYSLLKKYLTQGKSMDEAYSIAKKDPGFFNPITITTNKVAYKNSFDKPISNKLFTYKKGDVTDVMVSVGGTFILGVIKGANDTPYATLDDWIAAQSK